MTEQLFNSLKATETLALDAMKVYGLHLVQALARRQSINLHSPSLGHYCLNNTILCGLDSRFINERVIALCLILNFGSDFNSKFSKR